MKRYLNRVICCAMALALCLGITACGNSASGLTPDEVMEKAQKSMDSITSMSYDMTINMEMSVDGESIIMNSDAVADCILDPMQMKIDMTMDMGEIGSLATTEYVVGENGQNMMYIGMDLGAGQMIWAKQEFPDLSSLEQYDAKATMNMYIDSAESFTQNGTESINGVHTTRYDGVIKGDAIEQVIDASGIMEQYAALGLDDETMNLIQGELGDLPISIWVADDSYVPMKYEMDMTDMMQVMMTKMSESMDEENPDITIDAVLISMTMKNINGVSEIVLPEEALNAEIIG